MTACDEQPNLFVRIDASASGFAAIKSFFARTSAYTDMEQLAPSHPIALTGILLRTTKLPNTEFRASRTRAMLRNDGRAIRVDARLGAAIAGCGGREPERSRHSRT